MSPVHDTEKQWSSTRHHGYRLYQVRNHYVTPKTLPPATTLTTAPDPPDSVTVEEFLRDEKYGRYPAAKARNPFTCALSGKSYTVTEIQKRTCQLSRALAKRLCFDLSDGTEWDRVVCIFSLNTVGNDTSLLPLHVQWLIHSQIDYVPVTHAVHRASGIVTAASASYGAQELEHQLRASGAKAVFTCIPLLDTALQAAKAVGIPPENVFILPMARFEKNVSCSTVDDLIEEGQKLEALPLVKFIKGQGRRQVAFLMFSSGTSGLPVSSPSRWTDMSRD